MKRLLLALMGFFFVHGQLQAEEIPASNQATRFCVTSYCSQAKGTSVQAACDAGLAYLKGPGGVPSAWLESCTTVNQPSISVGAKVADVTYKYGTGTPIYQYVQIDAVAIGCPDSSWTLNGSTCFREACKAGQTRVNGFCTCDTGAQTGTDGTCCPVAGSGGGAPMQWCYVDSATASTCDSAGTNGCKVRCNNVTYQKGTGSSVQIYPKMALGQNCSFTGTRGTNLGGGPLNDGELKQVAEATRDPAKAKTPEGCMAAGMGYVQSASGTTCVPSGDTGVVKKESSSNTTNDNGQQTTESKTKETTSTPTGGETKETTTKTNPDGTTTTTTKTTTCKEDGTCTTSTTETTKDANGNTVGNKSSSNQQSASEFCKANPDSDMCKGASDGCKDHPDRLGCMGAGEAIEQPDLSTTEKGITAITPFNISSNATCPADLPLPKGMSFSFQPFCDYASAFRPIILALAWITAGFLAFGYRGNNG